MKYTDTGIRHLTIEESATNKANQIWYEVLTPYERLEIMSEITTGLTPNQQINACLNFIEDTLRGHLTPHAVIENALMRSKYIEEDSSEQKAA